jgi:hypothetical protein
VVADERFVNLVMPEQVARVAGVLAGDEIRGLECLQSPESDVPEITDRSGDQ